MNRTFDALIRLIAGLEGIESIGKTGCKEFPAANDGDVDIFIYCGEVPDVETRKKLYGSVDDILNIRIHDFESRHWGTLDSLFIDGVEICLMYFSVEKTKKEIDDILNGERLIKEDNYFYPAGRCAALKNINILFDRHGFLESMRILLSVYPEKFRNKILEYNMPELNDTEDLDRAAENQDVLFYHFALDISLDHYLQLLFAINDSFFPSRKRSLLYVKDFKNKPDNCVQRILEIIELGGNAGTVGESCEKWKKLCGETFSGYMK